MNCLKLIIWNLMDKYIWLFKHLIKNGPQPTKKVYWIYLPKKDADMLREKFEVVSHRTLPKGAKVDVISALDNYFVLNDSN